MGAACGAVNECVAGAQCLDRDGVFSCLLICTDTCNNGTCTDTGLGFSVCMVVR